MFVDSGICAWYNIKYVKKFGLIFKTGGAYMPEMERFAVYEKYYGGVPYPVVILENDGGSLKKAAYKNPAAKNLIGPDEKTVLGALRSAVDSSQEKITFELRGSEVSADICRLDFGILAVLKDLTEENRIRQLTVDSAKAADEPKAHRSPQRRKKRQRGQVQLPVQHVPRYPHADERHRRVLGAP